MAKSPHIQHIRKARTAHDDALLAVARAANEAIQLAEERTDGTWTLDAETMATLQAAAYASDTAREALSRALDDATHAIVGGA